MGLKKIETRSFDTKHRGPLLIHASKGISKQGWHLYCDHLHLFPTTWKELSFGAIIGQVNIIGTQPTDRMVNAESLEFLFGEKFELNQQEFAFGDYSSGRFGWLLSDAVQFAHPIPAKGQLQLWNYDMPDHIHVPVPHGDHATFSMPPTKELLDAVNTMAEIAHTKFSKG